MTTGFLFLPKECPRCRVPEGAILLRFVYAPNIMPGQPGWQDAAHRDLLATYPATVLYGGPTHTRHLQTEMGSAFLNAMRMWFFHQNLNSEGELVPIAHEEHGHTWPHREWRWWYVTEHQPRTTYKLALWRMHEGKPVMRWVHV